MQETIERPAGSNYESERFLFSGLYTVVLGLPFDISEFDSNELYAFQIFERAMLAESPELRNMATHLQGQRHPGMENITLQSSERLNQTWRMPTLTAAQAAAPPVAKAAARGATQGATPGSAHGPAKTYPERRGGMCRFTVQEILDLSTLQRLFRKQFNRTLDVTQFAENDPYGRQVLAEAVASGNAELIAAAGGFLDAEGKAYKHRRNY